MVKKSKRKRKRWRKREIGEDRVELVMYNLKNECQSKDESKSNSKFEVKGKANGRQADGRIDRQTV